LPSTLLLLLSDGKEPRCYKSVISAVLHQYQQCGDPGLNLQCCIRAWTI